MGSNDRPDENEIHGIIVGYVIYFSLLTIIVTCKFSNSLKNPNKSTQTISPEDYFQTAVLSLCSMIITGIILTSVWSHVNYHDNPLIQFYGYNNICIVFDTSPSTFVMPVCWFFTGFFLVCYAVADSKRIWRLPKLSKFCRVVSQMVDILLIFVASFGSLFVSIQPEQDMIAHTVPFLSLIIILPCVYAVHCWQSCQRSWTYVLAVVLYGAFSAVKASLTIIALATKHHLSADWAQRVDIIWLLLAIPAPFLMPPPAEPVRNDDPDGARKALFQKLKTRAFYAGAHALPLLLLFIPMTLLSILWSITAAFVGRLRALVMKPTPVAVDFTNIDSTGSKIVPTVATETGQKICPLKFADAYVGDIFGYYMNFWKGFHVYAHALAERLESKVFALNIGFPVVGCFDTTSAETFNCYRSELNFKFISQFQYATQNLTSNIVQDGTIALQVREMTLHCLPQSPRDESFARGVSFMRQELYKLTELDDEWLTRIPVDQALDRVIVAFVSGAMVGDVICHDLLQFIYPMPQIQPLFPWMPLFLLPSYYAMMSAINSTIELIHNTPRWPEIANKAKEIGAPLDAVSRSLLIAIGLNSSGLRCSFINSVFILPLLPLGGKELVANEALLESFCWEVLRFCGLALLMEAKEETNISSSKGEHYKVKAGTKLFTHTGYQSRDEAIYADPHVFKLDRFLKAPPRDMSVPRDGMEPLPISIFNCPFGHMDRMEEFRTCHRCPMMPFAQPLLKEFVKLVVTEFTWDLNRLTKRTVNQLVLQNGNAATNKYLHINMLPDVLRGGLGADDQVIATPIKPFFVSFKSVPVSVACDEGVEMYDRK
mmetsp:Transcript_19568/g.26860  ORF Transcript_19568/g.26860 Transcript_19568/m.26860 type:complete len:827 (+) Transcript_19568:134-2614(+)